MLRQTGLLLALAGTLTACEGRIVLGLSPLEHADLSLLPTDDLLSSSGPDARLDHNLPTPSDQESSLDLSKPADDLGTTPGICPSDTVTFDTYCMDRYEAPNIEGEYPFYYQTAPDGENWCGGKGRRLCTETEWKSACQGPNGLEYPYGNTFIKSACNDDKTWISPNWAVLGTYPAPAAHAEADRLYQGDPSGSRMMCLSDAGVYDLTGNVAEWVRRSLPHTNNYDYVIKGCYWATCYMDSTPDCNFTNSAHPPEFRSYEFGFRCCMDRP